MKQLTHPQDIPRQLEQRQQQPFNDPRKAWDSFSGKQQLQTALLPVQKHLCAYCEIELDSSPNALVFHLEHIASKSLNPLLTFAFQNLMLSCFQTGKEIELTDEDSSPVSCGHAELKRNNQYDAAKFIKPTEQDCQKYFFYELDGRVVPHHSLNDADIARAEHTIAVLNLNCLRLKRQRADMIKEGFEILTELSDAPEALSIFIDLEINEIATNKLRAFHTTRLQYFQELA